MSVAAFAAGVAAVAVAAYSPSHSLLASSSQSSRRPAQRRRRRRMTLAVSSYEPTLDGTDNTAPLSSSSSPFSLSRTLIVGLNAALQKRFVLSNSNNISKSNTSLLIPGTVHRAAHISTGVGGKGQDVAVTLQCLEYYHHHHPDPPPHSSDRRQSLSSGGDSKNSANAQQHHHPQKKSDHVLQLAQFIGRGAAGDAVHDLLQSILSVGRRPSIPDDDDADDDTTTTTAALAAALGRTTSIRTDAPLRTCTSIVASDCTTELVEPSGTIAPHELDQLLSGLLTSSPSMPMPIPIPLPKTDAVCIMGSMPPGCPPDTYAKIYRAVVAGNGSPTPTTTTSSTTTHNQSPLCLIDSVVGLDALLAVLEGPTILKINAAELSQLVVAKLTMATTTTMIDDDDDDTDTTESPSSDHRRIASAVAAFFHQYNAILLPPGATATPSTTTSSSCPLKALAVTDGKDAAYLAIVDDAVVETQHPSGESSSSSTSLVSTEWNFSLYRLPVANLLQQQPDDDTQLAPTTTTVKTLYPIGAGDAVAAGTLAAWQYLTKHYKEDDTGDDDDDNGMVNRCLPLALRTALSKRVAQHQERWNVANEKGGNTNNIPLTNVNESTTQQRQAAVYYQTAFALGLACGSASCLQEENSVVSPPDVVRLFRDTPMPELVAKQSVVVPSLASNVASK